MEKGPRLRIEVGSASSKLRMGSSWSPAICLKVWPSNVSMEPIPGKYSVRMHRFGTGAKIGTIPDQPRDTTIVNV